MSILKIIAGIILVLIFFFLPPLLIAIQMRKKESEEEKKVGTPPTPKKKLSNYWWEYFKPLAAIPFAWLSFHYVFYLIFPNVFKEIWNFNWDYLLAIEISALFVNSIVNKKIPFEQRATRKLMELVYILTPIGVVIMIILSLFYAEAFANTDRDLSSRLTMSRVELTLVKIEKSAEKKRIDPIWESLQKINKEADEEGLSSERLAEANNLYARAKENRIIKKRKNTPSNDIRFPPLSSGTFKITEGDGKNTEENAIPTGIKEGEGWKAYYVREEGEGPVRIRTGSGENDFLEFSGKTFLTDLHGEIGETEIQFLRWKPAKISVRVFKK